VKKLLLSVGLLVLGCGLAVVVTACGSEHAVSLGKPATTAATTTEHTGSVPSQLSLEVWFARDGSLTAVRRMHAPTQLVATAAVTALLDGPTSQERGAGFTSAVPDDTRLLGIGIRDGVATVDLTSEYQSGGGALSMQTRLGQVVYTLTQFPTVKGVLFELDGQHVDVLGGEGVVVDEPVTRKDYRSLMPAILVTDPQIGERVDNPVVVQGSANVFEANVTVEIVDAGGKVVGHAFTTASCGTGCRGTFSVEVPYEVSSATRGLIIVHDDDAAGTGTPPHEVRIPVVLTQSS